VLLLPRLRVGHFPLSADLHKRLLVELRLGVRSLVENTFNHVLLVRRDRELGEARVRLNLLHVLYLFDVHFGLFLAHFARRDHVQVVCELQISDLYGSDLSFFGKLDGLVGCEASCLLLDVEGVLLLWHVSGILADAGSRIEGCRSSAFSFLHGGVYLLLDQSALVFLSGFDGSFLVLGNSALLQNRVDVVVGLFGQTDVAGHNDFGSFLFGDSLVNFLLVDHLL